MISGKLYSIKPGSVRPALPVFYRSPGADAWEGQWHELVEGVVVLCVSAKVVLTRPRLELDMEGYNVLMPTGRVCFIDRHTAHNHMRKR